jgi:hypothetical protein
MSALSLPGKQAKNVLHLYTNATRTDQRKGISTSRMRRTIVFISGILGVMYTLFFGPNTKMAIGSGRQRWNAKDADKA